MQEEIEDRAVALAIRCAKLTGDVLRRAIGEYLAYRKEKDSATVRPAGKKSVRELVGEGEGVSSLESFGTNVRGFERIARKYGVEYAARRDRSGDEPRVLVFFRTKDAAALQAAFREYTAKKDKQADKPSVVEFIRKQALRDRKRPVSRVRNRDRGLVL